MKKPLKRISSLALALVMTLSLAITPLTSYATSTPQTAPPKPDSMTEIVNLLDGKIDGEKAFDYLSYVYLGWRTTGGPWQNKVIKGFIGDQMTDAGYTLSTTDRSKETTVTPENDFFYVQHDDSTSLTWAPEYARLQIVSITPPVAPPPAPPADPKSAESMTVAEPDANKTDAIDLPAEIPTELSDAPAAEAAPEADTLAVAPADALTALSDAKAKFDVESFSFDPTSAIYQKHYNEKYSLGATTGADGNFIPEMWKWIIKKGTVNGVDNERVNVFPAGKEVGAARGEEAELNKRAHLATNSGFNATAEEMTAVRAHPENVSSLVAGKTGDVVYVGAVKKSGTGYTSDYTGTEASLAGKVLLSDSSNSTTFKYAKQVGAVSVMSTAALDDYSTPDEPGKWYGGEAGATNWYTDSARFAGGAGATANKAAMDEGKPIVEWNISNDQYDTMKALLDAGNTVKVNVATVGTMYNMNDAPGEGQLTAIAEIKGAVHPEERIVLAAHVQEPSSNDNATGVGLNIELATKMKSMIDDGTIARPDRTITFLWGDEMAFSTLYLNAHPEEAKKIVCSIDLDMVGEDTAKTGGPMRIEKAPDPSAYYNYTLDTLPGQESYYDEATFADPEGNFTRLPDSHTLWGAGNPGGYDLGGVYLNDLYMAAAQAVIMKNGDANNFKVDVCPYEGGSDHSKFLKAGIPAVLTWHFTDYVYHTTVDTLYMSSAQEMKDVGITSLATAYMMANPTDDAVKEVMGVITAAAVKRLGTTEKANTEHHRTWADATHADRATELAQEQEVLNAWGTWYKEAINSCGKYLSKTASYEATRTSSIATIDAALVEALRFADVTFTDSGMDYKATIDLEKNGAPMTGRQGLALSNGGEDFTATLTIDATNNTELKSWSVTNWNLWAKNLNWSLTRESVDPTGQDPELYPNIYTGDSLKNWRTWGDKGPLFNVQDARYVSGQGTDTVTIELSFTTNPFYGTTTGATGRNVFGSFIGTYQLNAHEGAGAIAKTPAPLKVNIYDSYRIYNTVGEELEAIQEAAEANGRYLEIHNYGDSEGGFPLYYVALSDTQKSIEDFHTLNAEAVTNPAAVQEKIKQANADYRIPFFMNNVHSDECPGSDAQLNLLWTLATEEDITFNTLTGLKTGTVDKKQFDPKITDIQTADGEYQFTGLGSRKFTSVNGELIDNDGEHDAQELYNISEAQTYKVDDLLKNLIILSCPAENPDGITYNSRRNNNGFDLNRDASNQTQLETIELYQEVAKWNPTVFAEMHGYMTEFLVEPCTPPHEPNLEYDLLVENFLLGAEAFGKAALGTMSKKNDGEDTEKFWSYYTPLRDDFDPKTTTWSAWDDLCTNYGPSYAMLNCHAMGFTIETPSNNETSTNLLECGLYGLLEYVMSNKQAIYTNQLEFFKRGLENNDVSNSTNAETAEKMNKWYVDINNKELPKGTWRKPGANGNYFPEYWVLPVAAAAQRDPADAYEMGRFLIRNGVNVSALTADVKVGETTYHKGDLVVNMYQAKRNYANAVLWQGADASNSGFPDLYSESVSNFPAMRGFNCVRVDVKDAFAGKLSSTDCAKGVSQFSGTPNKAVVLSNGGQEAVRAVNALLADDEPVGLITEGAYKGDYLMSYVTYQIIADEFVLVATGVETAPVAYPIAEPEVFLAGRYDPFSGNKVTSGYYSQWFKDGYGYINYRNVHNNGTYGADVVAYDQQLDFNITTDPAQASVIVGSVALNQGETGAAAEAAVKAGIPYIATGIATGSSPLKYLKSTLLKDQLDYTTLGMESLHYVTYPTPSLTTSSYVNDNDNVLYSVNCAALTQIPAGAQVLIQGAPTNSHIAGCCLTEDGRALDGRVEAFALKQNGMDLTVLGNSIINRAHQQDDYRYVTNTIYSKSLGATRMTIDGVPNESIPDNSGSGSSGARPSKPETVKNPDGSTTATVTDKQTGSQTATTTYPGGAKAVVVTPTAGNATASVTLPSGTKSATLVLPMAKPAAGMVARIVNSDGTTQILKWSAPAEGGMKVTLDGSAKLEFVESGKTFADVPKDNWASDSVAFVSGRDLFQGTGEKQFSPAVETSFGMIATVLHRLDGAAVTPAAQDAPWYTDGVKWVADQKLAENTDPDGSVSREALVLLCYRYATMKGISYGQTGPKMTSFADAADVSANSADAMAWAVGAGIINGKDGNKLDPAGSVTRAELSTIFMRLVSYRV